MRALISIVGALFLLLSSAVTHAQMVLKRPDLARASQLIFYYDAREGFTTFVNIQNFGNDPLRIRLALWGPTLTGDLSSTFDLAGGAVRVLDIGSFKGSGLPAQQGIAIASILNEQNLPIHNRVLQGNFTVANLATGSAWGSPAAGRSARDFIGREPPIGTIVDGVSTKYQIIQPDALVLATYYNPQTLAPVADHGNQLIFVNFLDGIGDGVGVSAPLTPASTNWLFFVRRGADGTATSAQVEVSGVTERDLVSVLGTEANGTPGGGGFVRGAGTENANRFIFFVQSLGTFGTGYLLPSID
jgi:hypothetical protein